MQQICEIQLVSNNSINLAINKWVNCMYIYELSFRQGMELESKMVKKTQSAVVTVGQATPL